MKVEWSGVERRTKHMYTQEDICTIAVKYKASGTLPPKAYAKKSECGLM